MNGINLACTPARKFWQSSLILLLGLVLTACGGGSGGSSDQQNPQSESGEVIIGLTDAEGDFHSYTVDVLSLKLTHQNGSEVETLPLSTRVDFAQYTELTEFLTAATIPNGIYTSASLIVDYSNAEIIVEDAVGDGVEGIAIDSSSTPLGQLELEVEFENSNTLRIAPGIPAHITLDFDLAASNTVDFSTVPAVVRVDPILIADTILEDPKPHRLRGLLNLVSVEDDIFSIFIRPFYRHNGNFGSLRVHSVDETLYEINEEDFQGHAGIVALNDVATRTPMVVLGQLNRDTREFIAEEVLAGTSVPWGEKDLIQGSVIARTGNELTLSRVVRRRQDNEVRHQQFITVTVSEDTTVKKQGSMETVNIEALSVGQRIRVIGEFTDDLSLDASGGYVRMLYTQVNGETISDLPLILDLQSIDGRRASAYDFEGTGAVEDADPNNYEIETGTLSLSVVNLGDPIKVKGHVTPFGTAPADFTANTVIEVANVRASLLINWSDGGSTAPFLVQSDEELVLDLESTLIGNLHTINRAGVFTDLLSLNTSPSIKPLSTGRGVFIISRAGRTRMYLNFENFASALSNQLDGSNTVLGFSADGHYDNDTASFEAKKIVVRMN